MPRTLRYDVVGIGNAIVDVIASADDAFLEQEGLSKGRMVLIDTARAEELYSRMAAGVETSGGCAANTAVGVTSFGGKAAFIGKVANDELGRVFKHDINAAGVHYATPVAPAGSPPTARCLIVVTPDAERTMSTYLGAAGLITAADMDAEVIGSSKVIYLEGYQFDIIPTKAAFYRAAGLAHAAGGKVALSLSDKFCVEMHHADFTDLISKHVDILFANEAEITALYKTDFDACCEAAAKDVEIACLTRGAAGSVIVANGETIIIPAEPVERVIDTTGAGDLYAAGFLYGLTHGMDLRQCGRLAGIAAAEIISHVGPRPQVKLSELMAAAGV